MFLTTLLTLTLPLVTGAAVTQADFTGPGEIWVLKSADWRTASPAQKIGCLTDSGRLIGNKIKSETTWSKRYNAEARDEGSATEKCGVFEKLYDYPYTLASRAGNCTFTNQKTETNKDSVYGRMDHAWSCRKGYAAEVYDGLYTIDGFPYPFLCWGDIACYYDIKKIPSARDRDPLWQFRWGSQQEGITPGHVQVQLMFHKVGNEAKREGVKVAPGPRVEVSGVQERLLGQAMEL